MARHIVWTRDANPQADAIAVRFLDGERELLRMTGSDPTALTAFLEILVAASRSDDMLLLTGKTAGVLRAYLDDEPVSMRDRADMTVRRRID